MSNCRWLAAVALLLLVSVRVNAENPLVTEVDEARRMLNTEEHDSGVTRLKQAIKGLNQACAKAPKDAELRYNLGRAHFYLAQDAQALSAFDEAIRLNPQMSRAHFFKGLVFRYSKKPDAAAAEFSKGVELAPEDAAMHLELGRSLERLGKNQEALKQYREALKLNPKEAEACYRAGVVSEACGQREQAKEYMAKALELEPKSVQAAYNLGLFAQLEKKPEAALDYMSKVVKLDPDDWQARAKLVQIYESLGKPKLRDQQIAMLRLLHKAGKVKGLAGRQLFCRDQFTVGKENLMVFEYFELKGPRPILYAFKILKPNQKESAYTISLGSYDITNAIAKDPLQGKQRIWHLDGYFPDGTHYTYEMFEGRPSYDKVKALVTLVVEGKKKPVSASVPGRAPENPAEDALKLNR